MSRSVVVANPKAANGRVEKCWDEIEATLRRHLGDVEILRTSAPGDATRLAAEAIEAGAERIGSLGGDGTHSQVVNGFFDASGNPRNPDACLCVLPVGTGGDFRKVLDIQGRDLDVWAREMARGTPTPIDAGAVDIGEGEKRERRYFLNIASFGMAGTVDEIVNSSTKFFGGKLTFAVGTARGLWRYDPPRITVTVDGEVVFDELGMSVSVANGRYFGGGMKIAPDAEIRDGLFDVVFVPWKGRLHHVVTGPRVYRGAHLGRGGAFVVRGREVRLTAGSECLIDLDGEMVGGLPATCHMMASSLRITGLRAR